MIEFALLLLVQQFQDSPTADWFKSLSSPYTKNCCSQADCRKAASDFRDGKWYAKSNYPEVGDEWIEITPERIVPDTLSIFPEAILCEGVPEWNAMLSKWVPRLYCFVRPPIVG